MGADKEKKDINYEEIKIKEKKMKPFYTFGRLIKRGGGVKRFFGKKNFFLRKKSYFFCSIFNLYGILLYRRLCYSFPMSGDNEKIGRRDFSSAVVCFEWMHGMGFWEYRRIISRAEGWIVIR